MDNYSPVLFDVNNSDEWKQYLDEHGYVVLQQILSGPEKLDIFSTFVSDMNTVSPRFDLNNKQTLKIENTPIIFGKGMAVFNGWGQSNFMWKLRTNEKIKCIFEKIHGTNELVTSLDGFSLYVSKKQTSKSWLHIDQNPSNDIYSIQGAYNFKAVMDEDAGFIVVPGSHKNYHPMVDHKRDWIVCKDQEEIFKYAVKLNIPENCFVLWNSKTIHANIGMKKNELELNRLTAYITYLPKHLRTPGILQKRIDAYKNSQTTSHWANKCELKRYPFGFKKTYESRGYGSIKSHLDEEGYIPNERLELL